jgi:hypothetical protein
MMTMRVMTIMQAHLFDQMDLCQGNISLRHATHFFLSIQKNILHGEFILHWLDVRENGDHAPQGLTNI